MPVVPFGEWLPDQADFNNPGTVNVVNALPTASGYEPVKSLTVSSVSGGLDARPRGAITARDKFLVSRDYAADAGKIYQRSGQSAFLDVSKVGGYSTATEELWEFVQWKNKVLATNFNDDPQQITLGDTNFSDLTTDFKARHIATVSDFVVFGNTIDPADGEVTSRVRWSGINDETTYTVSPVTLSDSQDIKTGGAVQRIVGGEFGVVLMDNSIWRMTPVGAPLVFQFDEVLPGVGTLAGSSVVRDGDLIYFLSDRGFFVLNQGTQAQSIGSNKVDNFVLNDLDRPNAFRITATLDTATRRVYWAYPGPGNIGGRPNRIVIYDPTLDRWSRIHEEVEILYKGTSGSGFTLEDLDTVSTSIDTLPASLDSSQWKGGVPILAAFDKNFNWSVFSGANMPATLETKELELNAGRRTRLNAFRPVIEGGTATAKIGSRNNLTDAATFGSELTRSQSGRYTDRVNARFHRFRLELSGDWTQAIGVQVISREAGRGEWRG